MKQALWVPSEERRRQAGITRFIAAVNERHALDIRSYDDLWRWSVECVPEFWAAVWEFAGTQASRGYTQVVDDLSRMPGAHWFPGARLNFAENLLRYRDDRPALLFRGESARTRTMTYAELHGTVARVAASLRALGVGPGDRVAGYLPNLIETAVAMLAATSVGATWCSCATDIGPAAALDRLGQVAPAVLFTADGYFYKGKAFDTRANAAQVARGIPGLRRVVVVPYLAGSAGPTGTEPIPHAVPWEEFLAPGRPALQFEQLPFEHPVYIMFSSGTTGKPKCMVQGCGVLLNQLKEMLLHADVKRESRILYMTSCSWMMWNWLMSALGVGATVVLTDGCPTYPDAGAMWQVAQDLGITHFGTSASYLEALRKQDVRSGATHDLAALQTILQTGSPLSAEGFEYVYRRIKQDVHFNSIAGGTDINGCFAAGSPISPVYAGEVQSRALGMKVQAYDEAGNPVTDRQGELVCEAPAPCMPTGFWNDPDGSKYRDAYFTFYPGKNVWRHGDTILLHGDTGGVTFYGRSDAVLKPSGVRIGTAEIYNVVQALEGVADSLAIGQNWEGDQRILLFVKMQPGYAFTEETAEHIRRALRENASPRHVPAVILPAPDIPYTFSMKKVESAVANIVNGRPVTNRDALVNPECLEYYEKVAGELQG